MARPGGRILDRLVRGRAWVLVVGGLLAGVVFLNLHLLQVNRDIAATSERAAELRRDSADLRMDVARLGSTERIREEGERLGLGMPAPEDVTYVEADPEASAMEALSALDAKARADASRAVPGEQAAPATGASATAQEADPAG